MNRRSSELLTAYADGGVTPEEAAEVEALLTASPEARAELEAIRRVLAEARRAEPGADPDWDAMAREIQRACEATPPTSRLARARAWLWPRPIIAVGAVGAVAAAIAIAVLGQGGGNPVPVANEVIAPSPEAEEPEVADEDEALPALREPEIDDLMQDEIDQLDDQLAASDLGDDGFIADLLDGTDPGTGDDEPTIDAFAEPGYLSADELSDDEIEAMDQFLAEVSAG
jgi:anti-sigma factor RsiW